MSWPAPRTSDRMVYLLYGHWFYRATCGVCWVCTKYSQVALKYGADNWKGMSR